MGASYSLSYSAYVVRTFHRIHARAATFLGEMYHFPEDLPVLLFSENQRRWNRYKFAVKTLHTWMDALGSRVESLSADDVEQIRSALTKHLEDHRLLYECGEPSEFDEDFISKLSADEQEVIDKQLARRLKL